MKDNNDEFVLEQTIEVLKPKVSKKCSVKNKTATKRCNNKITRCPLTVDFVEEQTGDKYKNCDNYKKTKRSY